MQTIDPSLPDGATDREGYGGKAGNMLGENMPDLAQPPKAFIRTQNPLKNSLRQGDSNLDRQGN